MDTVENYQKLLKLRLSKKRFTHSLNVAEESRKLALRWNADPQKAYLAGLLHDICKELAPEVQKALIQESKLSVTPEEAAVPALWHAIAGAVYAEKTLGIADKDFLNAIRYHTVARSGMTRLEEVVYMADLISADRTYDEIDAMRRLAYDNLDKAMLEALIFAIQDIVRKGSRLPLHTVEAYNQYTFVK